jgi:hypothetical protein
MKKAKTKSTKKKKSAEKILETKIAEPVSLEEVRKKIRAIVSAHAPELTAAIVELGVEGQLAPVKFLFELLGFEHSDDEEEKPQEDSLALLLLKQLGLPTEPAKEEEDEAPLREMLNPQSAADAQTPEEDVDPIAATVASQL